MKKALFLLLTICLVVGLMTATVSAEELSGECNNGNITWTLNSEGTITFTGTGDIEDLEGSSGYAWVQYTWTPYKDQIRRVVIGEGITSVGDDAFYECRNLTEVVLPESMMFIRDHAFCYCENLKSIDLPTTNPLYIGEYTFAETGLTEIYLPDNVKDVNKYAFTKCKSLTKARLSNGQFYILRESVFANCTALTEIDFGTSISYIADHALYNTGFTELTLPDTITFLDNDVFGNCRVLKTMDLGAVGYIGKYAFLGCPSLESVTVGPELSFIGWNAFKNCENIRDIYISDLTKWCLVEVEGLESSPVIYAEYLYLNGSLVEDLVIPKGITKVVSGFAGLPCIKTVMFADTVTDISAAFQDCPNLTTAVIPASVTNLSNHSFYKCPNMKTIYYQGTEAQWEVIDPWKENDSYYRPANAVVICNYFQDVSATDFYAHPVLWAYENGITSGTAPTIFSPDTACNRAQVVTFLWRAAGSPEPTTVDNPFTDVSEDRFYYKAVLWAVENGITRGTTDTTFSPDRECDRATVVTFLYRANGEPEISTTESEFSDVTNPKAYYYNAVLWAAENNITKGMGDGTFGVNGICNRGQVVTFLYRAYVN